MASTDRLAQFRDHLGWVTAREHRGLGWVSLYRSAAAGMEDDPTLPWSTVCETHATLVCHETRAAAEIALSLTNRLDWCEDCRAERTGRKEGRCAD